MDEFLARLFLGNTVKQWFVSLAFILGGLAAGKIASLVVTGIARGIHKKAGDPPDTPVLRLLLKPLTLLFVLGGIGLGLGGLNIHEAARLWIDRTLKILCIGLVAWALGRIADALILRCVPRPGLPGSSETDLQPLLRRLLRALAVIVAGALILRVLGYNISALLAGLGIGGAALALASKDTLSNIFGSITVFMDRPFRINDRIKIGNYDGVVIEMGLRTSRLRTLENRIVSIPNGLFVSAPIENISSAPSTKITQTIRLRGDNGSEKIGRAIDILRDIGSTTEGLEESPIVGLASPGGLVCQAVFIYYISKKAVYMDTINRVNLEILRRFEEEGIRLV
jgi:MscS family membrane protein